MTPHGVGCPEPRERAERPQLPACGAGEGRPQQAGGVSTTRGCPHAACVRMPAVETGEKMRACPGVGTPGARERRLALPLSSSLFKKHLLPWGRKRENTGSLSCPFPPSRGPLRAAPISAPASPFHALPPPPCSRVQVQQQLLRLPPSPPSLGPSWPRRSWPPCCPLPEPLVVYPLRTQQKGLVLLSFKRVAPVKFVERTCK